MKAAGFWLFFFLLLVGLRHLPLPGLGSATIPVSAAILLFGTLVATVIMVRRDGALLPDVGLRTGQHALTQLLVGLGSGLVVVAAMIALVVALTPLQVGPTSGGFAPVAQLVAFAIIALLGLMEEVAFRAYPLFRLKDAAGMRVAVYVSAVIFAFYHGVAFENLLGPGAWGVLYAWMAFKTNSIALPTGFHIGLNWCQSLLGMKPKYGGGTWELSVSDQPGLLGTETLGVVMQIIVLVIGVYLVEKLASEQAARAS